MFNGRRLFNHIITTVFYSALAGSIVGLVIVLFKFCAGKVIHISGEMYDMLRTQPLWIIPAIAILALIAIIFIYIYKFTPNARGGGIPTSIGIVRGIIQFKWLRNTVSVFFASLATFLVGVPLGTEGPSVQIGTALGRGVSRTAARKNPALDRYIMTGGAAAGFTVATGGPISGIMFALEEAHQRISPLILLSATAASVMSKTVSDILSPVFGISADLFHHMDIGSLSPKDFWLPLAVGIIAGLFSVAFLKYYKVLHKAWTKKLRRIPSYLKILTVFLLTLIFGLISDKFVSTGHGLTDELMAKTWPVYLLLTAFVVRATLMILASGSGITGGMFLPILALGGLTSASMGSVLVLLGMDTSHYLLTVLLGVTASVAGMMKMPLTAIVFAIEALSLSGNVLPVIITSATAFLITEIFHVHSINESVLENRLHDMHGDEKAHVYDTFVTAGENSFAVGKQVRDILWPNNLFVLSVTPSKTRQAEVDEHGEKVIHAGDVLHVRYATFDRDFTHKELTAIVGEQEYNEEKIEKV